MRGVKIRFLGGLVAAASLATACSSDTRLADVQMAPRPTAEVVETTQAPPKSTTTTTTTEAPTTTEEPTTTTQAPTTLAAETTLPETTLPETTLPVTTLAPTTVAAPLPAPIAPPADSRGREPVIDIGSIEIPRLGLAAAMYEGIRLTTLDLGPGHWPGTAMPGNVGNVVVAGHRTSHSKPFRYLDLLAAGDEVIFNTAGGRFVYHVVGTEIVTPDAIRIVDQTADATATLFACHPVGSTRQRIVVHLALATG